LRQEGAVVRIGSFVSVTATVETGGLPDPPGRPVDALLPSPAHGSG
jgi:hypothetical protein